MKKHSRTSTTITIIVTVFLGWGGLWLMSQGGVAALHEVAALSVPSVGADLSASVSEPVSAPILLPTTVTGQATSSTSSEFSSRADSLTVIIGGDAMFDRNVRKIGESGGYDQFFSDLSSLFHVADISVVNLEGPVTTNLSKTLLPNGKTTKELVFTFATTTPEALIRAGISVVSLANNHTDNFGGAGFQETKRWLDASGMKYFGSPWNSSSTEAVIDRGGFHVAFVGYNAFQSGFDRITADVSRLSAEGDFVIVMPHWGEEYAKTHSAKMESQARALIAAGAKAVIGSHPHVIEDRQWISGVPVFYSLGNLLFDQYFSAEVMKGNIVALHLVGDTKGQRVDSVTIYEVSTATKSKVTLSATTVEEQ